MTTGGVSKDSVYQPTAVVQKAVYDFDILKLQETHLKENSTIACSGYECYVGAIRSRAVGLVTYKKREIKHKQT